ncbi:MAG: amylo-alpha-1,6-glucosidase, partial [Thermoplasmataceae archaeon]
MQPDGIGYHVRNEMGGLWYHPLRVIRNIWLEREGKILRPRKCTLSPWSYSADYGDIVLTASLPEFDRFRIELSGKGSTETILAIDATPGKAWLSPDDIIPEITFTDRTVSFGLKGNSRGVEAHFPSGKFSMQDHFIYSKFSDQYFVDFLAAPRKIQSKENNATGKYYEMKAESSKLTSSNLEIDMRLYYAKANLLQLVSSVPGIGMGLTAGHPDFAWFFGIDSFLSIPGMMLSGMFEEAFETLRTITRFSKNGRIPHEIVTNGVVYNEGDMEESALFPWALIEYFLFSGDTRGLLEMESHLWKALRTVLESDLMGRGIMEDSGAGTGIDVDVVSFLAMSIRHILMAPDFIFENEFSIDPATLKDIEKDLVQRLRKEFWMNELGTFANRMVSGSPVYSGFWTSLIPFYGDLASPQQYAKFIAGRGLRDISVNDEITVAPGGNSMPLNTG